MNWVTEAHREIKVIDGADLHMMIKASAFDREAVALIEELQAGIDILLKDYHQQMTELRDRKATTQQMMMYRLLDRAVMGVDYAVGNRDHSAVTVVVRPEEEDSDGPESETT